MPSTEPFIFDAADEAGTVALGAALAECLPARAVVALATRRCESRGAHWRTDHPVPLPEWRVRQVAQLMPTGEMAVGSFAVEGLHEAVVGQAAAAV